MDADGEAPVLVYAGGGGNPRADMFRSVLEGSDIQCYVKLSQSGLYPTNVGAFGDFEIYVKPGDAERARELLLSAEKDLPDPDLDEDWDDSDEEVDEENAYWKVEPEEGDPASP